MFIQSNTKVRIMINAFHTITNENTGKNFTVYRIEVVHNGQVTSVDKRYSEFYEVYRKLNKIDGIKMDFPAKHVLNRDQRLLESRRIGLEFYLQTILRKFQDDIPPLLLNFLQLGDIYEDSMDDEEEGGRDPTEVASYTSNTVQQQNLQPMISFKEDAFLEATIKELEEENLLPSIVMKGALLGLYT